jgi:hypothetical protein
MENFKMPRDEEFAAMNDDAFDAWWNARWDAADRNEEEQAAFWAAREAAEAARAKEA